MHAICRIGQVCGRKKRSADADIRHLRHIRFTLLLQCAGYRYLYGDVSHCSCNESSGSYLEYVSVAVYGRGNSACLGTVL